MKNEQNAVATELGKNYAENNHPIYITGSYNQPILDESKIKMSFMRQLMGKQFRVVDNSTL